jgi:putative (di)nucleoside polyphosphate hydrolase
VTPRSRSHRSSKKSRQKPKAAEPTLIMMLADPEVRLLMRADNVDEAGLLKMLKGVSVQLRKERTKRERSKGRRRDIADSRKYRRGVGIMLVNARSEIFIARRNDLPGGAWQMPQGGINRGESPKQAAYRELKEEIGTNNAEVLAEASRWLYYDLPEGLLGRVWGGRWKGQRQKWFVMLFKGTDAEIDLATRHPEFNAWRWASVHELEHLAVPFKQKLYASLLGEFATIFRD